ncbi:hypothetical protein ZHAS_00004771 [Anopheles sinensis]|uniref:c-Myc-binding protein n=1 Tax=Anopheles sinensis TaxID=74873 RepID=A0A084VHU6_ANOSI|nr:hypothetical protein ZHAS_00004771 [Anopheles sinensis]
MGTYKPIDISKEDFRKYLESTGVLDALTQAFIKCNAQRPKNAIEFVKQQLGDPLQETDVEILRHELRNARIEIEQLKKELSSSKPNTSSDEKLASSLDTTGDSETTPQKDTAVVQSSGESNVDTSTTASSEEPGAAQAAPVGTKEQGKNGEGTKTDAPTDEVQNVPLVEKPEEPEKQGNDKN